MTVLDELINFWTTYLELHDLSSQSYSRLMVKETIKALEELKKLKGEE